MKKYLDGLAILLATAWVGGIWMTGYIAAPVLFQALPDKMLAGMLAGKMFASIAWLGMIAAAYLMLHALLAGGRQVVSTTQFRLLAVMLLLVVAGHFGIQPVLAELKAQVLPVYVMDSVNAASFRVWHGAASMLYLLLSLLGGIFVLKQNMPLGMSTNKPHE